MIEITDTTGSRTRVFPACGIVCKPLRSFHTLRSSLLAILHTSQRRITLQLHRHKLDPEEGSGHSGCPLEQSRVHTNRGLEERGQSADCSLRLGRDVPAVADELHAP
jgi:hypothetical protein